MIKVFYEREKNRSVAYDGFKMVGEMTYQPTRSYWSIDHTYVNPAYRGQQIAQRLMQTLMENAVTLDVRILPVCSFAKKECDANPEFAKMIFCDDEN